MSNLALVTQPDTVPHVYAAIASVASDIARTGIGKDRKNEQQGYRFRGIDDVFNALSPLLAKHRLVILPRVLSRNQTERQTAKGGVLFSVVVDVEFDFLSAEDGTKHTVRTFGEGMDSADKATNKAMSAAYKYAAFQAFCIPVEGALDDGDKDHHEVAPKAPQEPVDTKTGEVIAKPENYSAWQLDMEAAADEGYDAFAAAWKGSAQERRAFATAHDRVWVDGLKKRTLKGV